MSFASNSVVAKARAVFGRSLTNEDYSQLVSKENVADVCAYLKTTPRYSKVLASVTPQSVHRAQLETLVQKAVFEVFESFHRFDHTESKGFFNYIVLELEIEQILLALQSAASGSALDFVAQLPSFLMEHSKVDLAALGRARNLSEALDRLGGTGFEKIIGDLILHGIETGRFNISECERRLYNGYYLRMLKAVERDYKGAERKELKRAVLRAIDMENVVTLYRYARIFGTPAAEIPEKLIRFKYRLTPEVVERLVEQKDIAKIASELALVGYGIDGEIPPSVEQLAERISLDFMKKTLRLSQSSSVVYFALTQCLETELKNIKTIIEGIRYKMKGSDILDMLVMSN